MKKVLLLASAVLVLFSSCEKEVTGVTLDEANLTLEVGDTATLTATILPGDAEGTVTWSSSNTTIASVKDGEVIALAEGTSNITATVAGFSATCVLTVNKAKANFTVSLTGTEYYPIILDGVTAEKLGTKIKADFRPDEVTKFLYIWDATFTPGTPSGPNCFGEVEPWTSLVVGSIGWSGAGFNCKDAAALDKLAPLTANPDKYYLHIGIKTKSNATFVFGLEGQSNVRFAVGSTNFNDNGIVYEPIADFPRDGEWQKIEIPLSTLKTKGLLFNTGMGDKNVFLFLAGGVPGTTIDLDAVFIYKKQ